MRPECSTRLRQALLPTTVALAWLGTGLCLSAAGITTSASGSLGEAPKVRWHEVSSQWDAFAAGPRERSLDLGYSGNNCGSRNLHEAVQETRTSVLIEMHEEVPEFSSSRGPVSCPAPSLKFLNLALARPLAGRSIRGRPGAVLKNPRNVFGEFVGGSSEKVPRLIGFAPQDAEHALVLAYLNGRVELMPASRGLRRVVAQYPAPGRMVSRNGVVYLRVAGR